MTEMQPYRADADVKAAETEIATIADYAAALLIVDEASNATALELLAQARKGVKRIEALRSRWLDPLNAQIKLIRGDFDAMLAPAKKADEILSPKISAYRAKVVAAAKAEEDRLRALAEARQARAETRAADRGLPPPPPAFAPMVVPPPRSTSVASGSVGMRKVNHFEIVDRSAVPTEYWTINEVAIGAAVRGGVTAIAGVRIWQTEEPVVR